MGLKKKHAEETDKTKLPQNQIPHICDICGKSLANKYVLANHRKLHTGEREYKCDYPGCDAAYTQANGLSL